MKKIKIDLVNDSEVAEAAAIIDANELFKRYEFCGKEAEILFGREMKKEGNYFYKAMLEDQMAGVAWVANNGAFLRSSYLRLIAIHPRHQGCGVGEALVKAYEKDRPHPHGVFLLVTKDNLPARKFYEKMGYRHIGDLPNYIKNGIDEAIYFKDQDQI